MTFTKTLNAGIPRNPGNSIRGDVCADKTKKLAFIRAHPFDSQQNPGVQNQMTRLSAAPDGTATHFKTEKQ